MTEHDDMDAKEDFDNGSNNNDNLSKDELELMNFRKTTLKSDQDEDDESHDVIELTDPVDVYSEHMHELSESSVEKNMEAGTGELELTDPLFAEDSLDLKALKLERIEKQVDRLYSEFNSKLKYDAHKEKIIDQLHNELQEYKNGLINKQVASITKDLIKIIDDITRFTNYNMSDGNADVNVEKLINYINHISSDLEDILVMQDIKPFRSDDDVFEPGKQRVVKKIETDDPLMDKKVVESMYPGYELAGKILRPEMVAVNIHSGRSTEKDGK
jgi:molecular chaperone GrpE (heat shock protein)